MKTAKTVGLVLVGMVIGAALASVSSSIEAQTSQSSPQKTRITRSAMQPVLNVDGQPGWGQMQFLKDTKSGGCWVLVIQPALSSGGNAALAVAAAPKPACD